MTNSDQALVSALKLGDVEAFQKIFQKYHHAIYYHALDFLKLPSQAEDVVQEVFIKIWENRSLLKSDLSFKAYLFCISKNLMLNQLKRLQREIKAKDEIAHSSLAFHNQVENQVAYNEYEAIAQKALENLPPKRKLVYTMHRLEGRKYEEIAVQMNISKNTVRDHVVKAEKSIKQFFSCEANITFSLMLTIFFT